MMETKDDYRNQRRWKIKMIKETKDDFGNYR